MPLVDGMASAAEAEAYFLRMEMVGLPFCEASAEDKRWLADGQGQLRQYLDV